MVALMYFVETDRTSVPIEDLKLLVRAGVGLWVTGEQKRVSTCLRRLEALGHVTVSRGERSRVERAPSKRPAPARRAPRAAKVAPPTAAPVAHTIDVAELVERAVKEAALLTAQRVAEQVLQTMPAPAPPQALQAPTGDLEALVEAALKKALAGISFGAPTGVTGTAPVDDDGPLFIPSGIVSGEAATDLEIQSESSEDSSLDEAAEALKQLRKKKKKRS